MSTNIEKPIDKINGYLADLGSLKPFPATANAITSACGEEDIDIQRVVQLIEVDPSLASKVLALANSPLYGAARQITTIGHSIVILGLKTVSNVAISLATQEVFRSGTAETAGVREAIFCQSLGCAVIARNISSKFQGVNADEAFLSGVTQDMGKLVLLDLFGTEYIAAVSGLSIEKETQVESEVFGMDHAELGKACGEAWGLPGAITDAISGHHLPLDEASNELVKVAIEANRLARQWSLGAEHGEPGGECENELDGDNTERDFESLKEGCFEAYQAVLDIFGACSP